MLCVLRLCLCEKALAEYLDTKRLAFPRFYFISSSDLLDILSNGTAPPQVRGGHLQRGPEGAKRSQEEPPLSGRERTCVSDLHCQRLH